MSKRLNMFSQHFSSYPSAFDTPVIKAGLTIWTGILRETDYINNPVLHPKSVCSLWTSLISYLWTRAALGIKNKALCLCYKQQMKQNINHKLSPMTSACILILTASISYRKNTERNKRKGVFEGKTCDSDKAAFITRQTQRWVAGNQLF